MQKAKLGLQKQTNLARSSLHESELDPPKDSFNKVTAKESSREGSRKDCFNKDPSWWAITTASFVNKVISLGDLSREITEKDLFVQNDHFLAQNNLKDFLRTAEDLKLQSFIRGKEKEPKLWKIQYEYVKAYWNKGAFLWFLCQILQISVPLIIQDYVDWLSLDRNARPKYKPWLYSGLLALIYLLRTISARRGMHYILETMGLVNNSVRVAVCVSPRQ